MFKSFKKGVHPREEKLTQDKPIILGPIPKKVIIPLQQHIGQACEPIVNIGDKVKLYQKIAEPKGKISAAVHSSICGKVVDICEFPTPLGISTKSIVIERNDEKEQQLDFDKSADNYNPRQLLDLIREAGVVGLGGACFPTHIKLQPTKPIDTLIVNGCECEPFLTNDHRLMLEKAEEIIKGAKIELKILGIEKAMIAIERNKEDSIAHFEKLLKDEKDISVVCLKTKYPQGAEKILIKAVLNRNCRHSALPMDVGVIVSNVATAKAIYNAVYYKKPLVERVVTVTGDVNSPQNILVRIGTLVRDLINFCNGYRGTPAKLIAGGPMMGVANYTDEVPVTKGTTGILVLNRLQEETKIHCVNCSRCVDACPYNLLPTTIAKASEKSNWQLAELYHAMECMECGCCAYVCPSKIPLVQHIRLAKAEIAKVRK